MACHGMQFLRSAGVRNRFVTMLNRLTSSEKYEGPDPTHERFKSRQSTRLPRVQAVLTGVRPSGEFPVRALGYESTAEAGPEPLWDGEVCMGATGARQHIAMCSQ